jgi:soluble lytic murein transglycosylase
MRLMMRTRWRFVAIAILASALAGCGSNHRAEVAPNIDGAGSAAQSGAQPGAATRPAPSSPEQAFVEGHQAYERRDFALAADRMKLAAAGYPQLGDYALFYLASAQRAQGDQAGAAASFRRVLESYPQSIVRKRGEAALAEIVLGQGDFAQARTLASVAASGDAAPETAQRALLVEAKAAVAMSDSLAGYRALQTIRRRYPHADADLQARAAERELLAAHPEIADTQSLAYHRGEAELLLAEGQDRAARDQIDDALALAPDRALRAELLWLRARSLRSDSAAERGALESYLKVAPKGAHAPGSLDQLGRIWWHEDEPERAKSAFARIVRGFPVSQQAPGAMMRIGRIFEEQGKLDKARAQYERAAARYPNTEAGADARFRAPWMLYLGGSYSFAAGRFQALSAKAYPPGERDMYLYWCARALERAGDRERARALYSNLAASTDSNYYPALAAMRAAVVRAMLPAATAADLAPGPPPPVGPDASFHLSRALALRRLGLNDLARGELTALRAFAGRDSKLRTFVLAEYQAAAVYHEAITMATAMAERGQLNTDVAERIRYPRAYWDLLVPAGARTGIEPYLLLALARQESLFDPAARSSSDARGLMQLLPTTAERVARQDGIASEPLDLYDPALNVRLGTAYLADLLRMFGGNQFRAVAAYNAGEHAVAKWNQKAPLEDDEWVEQIDFRETREYVKKVIGGRREYCLLYARGSSM